MNKTTEKLIQELQDSSDFCRGMSLDPHVDDLAKMACRLRATHIDTIVEEALEEEELATSHDIQAAFPEMLAVLKDLAESAAYWSEYDVPIGIVDRINAAIKKAEGGAA
jgi:hypothetical protein